MEATSPSAVAQTQTYQWQPYNTRMPQIGQSILFFPNPEDTHALSNGKRPGDPVAAIVTQVWSSVCVNLKVIPDHASMQDRGSVVHQTANPVGGYRWCFPEEYYTESLEVGTPVKSRAELMAEYFKKRIIEVEKKMLVSQEEKVINLYREAIKNYEADIAYLTSTNS